MADIIDKSRLFSEIKKENEAEQQIKEDMPVVEVEEMDGFHETDLEELLIAFVPEVAAADDPLSEPLCAVAEWFSGGTGKAIATVAIIFLGIAAFFGKVTWGLALMFAVGIFAIFGSADIIAAISEDGEAAACENIT